MAEITIKCISVQQPWASFLFGHPSGLALPRFKNVENRTWSTRYRGPLLIHASAKLDIASAVNWGGVGPFKQRFLGLPLGVIIGVVELTDVVTDHDSPWALDGQYHWVLSRPRRFKTMVPWSGRLGLYDVPISALGGQL